MKCFYLKKEGWKNSSQRKLSGKPSRKEKEELRLAKAVRDVQTLIQEGLESKVRQKLTKTVEQVAFVCEKYPSAKGNYSVLVFYWRRLFEHPTGDFKLDVVSSTSPETITRAYRKLQEHGFYLPSVKTSLKRKAREGMFRNMMVKDE